MRDATSISFLHIHSLKSNSLQRFNHYTSKRKFTPNSRKLLTTFWFYPYTARIKFSYTISKRIELFRFVRIQKHLVNYKQMNLVMQPSKIEKKMQIQSNLTEKKTNVVFSCFCVVASLDFSITLLILFPRPYQQEHVHRQAWNLRTILPSQLFSVFEFFSICQNVSFCIRIESVTIFLCDKFNARMFYGKLIKYTHF